MNFKKAQGLPINVVVMLIIGIILFGLGLGLFAKVSGGGEETIADLNDQIRTNIQNLECQDDLSWICTPSYKIKNGDQKTFYVFVTNRGEDNQEFTINIKTQEIDEQGTRGIVSQECGSVALTYFPNPLSIESGTSTGIPMVISATRVSKQECSFVSVVELLDENSEVIDKTSVIVVVD